jgi:prepilin-type N-terminal cleavage/methylation domain-containing protein/prepilin-type processing-associated H-X9-DG protein
MSYPSLVHRHRRHPARPRSFGFTLIELMIVITIITLLIAILMPIVSSARESSRQAVCMSNMRQIATAELAYALDHEGAFPPCFMNNGNPGTSNFATAGVVNEYPNPLGSILPYISNNRKIYTCPAGMDGRIIQRDPSEYSPLIDLTAVTNYMPNGVLFANRYAGAAVVTPGIRITAIHNPSGLVMFQEWMIFANSCFPRPMPISPGSSIFYTWHALNDYWGTGVMAEAYSNIHSHGGNLSFADGHAEYRSYTELSAADFGLTGGGGVTGHAADTWQAVDGLTDDRAP